MQQKLTHSQTQTIKEETPKPKSKKIVNIDGFEMTQEEWDEIKLTYVSQPTHYETQIADECKSYIVSCLNMIDRLVEIDDYEPNSSPEWLQQKAYTFLNLDLTKLAANNDFVLLEQFYEVISGLKCNTKQEQISGIIDTTIKSVENRWKDTYH